MTDTVNDAQTRLSPLVLIAEAWGMAKVAALPALPWLIGLCVAAGAFSAASQMQAGWGALAALFVAFCVGVEGSRRAYGAILGNSGQFRALAHTNLAIYLAFAFVGTFVGFFLSVLPGIFLMVAGDVEVSGDTDPAVIQAAVNDMMFTPYGLIYGIAILAGLLGLSYLALRLLIAGVKTVDTGTAHVFRTWPKTKGHVKPLALASLGTHVAPFAVAVGLSVLINAAIGGEGAVAAFARSFISMALLVPFILAGHGLAVAAYRKLDA